MTESEDYAYILFCLYIKNMSSLSRSSKKGRIREKLEEFLKQDQFIFNQLEFEEHDDEAVGVVDKNNAGWYKMYNIIINNCIVGTNYILLLTLSLLLDLKISKTKKNTNSCPHIMWFAIFV